MAVDDALNEETKMVNLAQFQRLETPPVFWKAGIRSFPAPCTDGEDAKIVLYRRGASVHCCRVLDR
jgi:hypothetical protein